MKGHRRSDIFLGDLPEDPQPGDIWRYLNRHTGCLLTTKEYSGSKPEMTAGNLTGGVWGFCSPDGNGMGTLVYHTVRENEDGTVSVLPGDGSSNSILHSGARDEVWHGYVYHNEWRPV